MRSCEVAIIHPDLIIYSGLLLGSSYAFGWQPRLLRHKVGIGPWDLRRYVKPGIQKGLLPWVGAKPEARVSVCSFTVLAILSGELTKHREI